MLNALVRFVAVIATDSRGLVRVCGPNVALRWLGNIVTHFDECRRKGSLHAADHAMGPGPFRARRKHAVALLTGDHVLSGIREIWVRDVYLAEDFLQIAPDALVVDLGANMGNFTMLALAHGPQVKVIGVEPSSERGNLFQNQLEVNGWQDRAVLHRCFLGGRGETQEELLQVEHFKGAEFVSQEDFLSRHHISRIDFLKCDIEGSEFDLLNADSPLLKATQQLAIEVHDFAGDRYRFLKMLEQCGFELGPVRHSRGDCIALARRPT